MIAVRWSDLLQSYSAPNVDVSVKRDDDGLIHVVVNGEELLCATISQTQLVFACLSRFFGKKTSKKLINVKHDRTERLVR